MRIGVFGGTFDPIHVGHLIVAGEARVRLGLDEVLFVTAGQPWFKAGQEVTPAHHRLAMVEAAIGGSPHFRAPDMEVGREGPTYTVETLEELSRTLGPSPELYLLVGLDALEELDRWRAPHRVLEMCTIVGIARPGREDLARGVLDTVRPGASEQVVVIGGPLIGVSSTEIRDRVRKGTAITDSVPAPVEAYIYEHGLYRGPRGQGRSAPVETSPL